MWYFAVLVSFFLFSVIFQVQYSIVQISIRQDMFIRCCKVKRVFREVTKVHSYYYSLVLLFVQTYRHPEWPGPWLGPRPAEECKRQFTEAQLRGGDGVIGLQAGFNKGATQAGQNFGAGRKILIGK